MIIININNTDNIYIVLIILFCISCETTLNADSDKNSRMIEYDNSISLCFLFSSLIAVLLVRILPVTRIGVRLDRNTELPRLHPELIEQQAVALNDGRRDRWKPCRFSTRPHDPALSTAIIGNNPRGGLIISRREPMRLLPLRSRPRAQRINSVKPKFSAGLHRISLRIF